MKFFYSILIAGSVVLILGIFQFLSKNGEGNYNRRLLVGNKTFMVEIASNFSSRATGLSGRKNLPPDSGMFFVFENKGKHGFWMKGMKFPLDIIWIDENEIKGFTENILPPVNPLKLDVYYPPQPVDKVLEINAGSVKKYNLKIGDRVELKD